MGGGGGGGQRKVMRGQRSHGGRLKGFGFWAVGDEEVDVVVVVAAAAMGGGSEASGGEGTAG